MGAFWSQILGLWAVLMMFDGFGGVNCVLKVEVGPWFCNENHAFGGSCPIDFVMEGTPQGGQAPKLYLQNHGARPTHWIAMGIYYIWFITMCLVFYIVFIVSSIIVLIFFVRSYYLLPAIDSHYYLQACSCSSFLGWFGLTHPHSCSQDRGAEP